MPMDRQNILDAVDVIVLTLDLEGRITLLNRFGCETLGWAEEELLGRSWIDTCIPADRRDEIRAKLREALDARLPLNENPVLTRSGEERTVEWRNRVLTDDAGRAVCLLSAGLDITERRRAEEESRQYTRALELSAEVGYALAHSDSLESALEKCAEALLTHLDAALARIWILNERDGLLELQVSAGVPGPGGGLHATITLGEMEVGRIAQGRKPYVTNRVFDDPEMSARDWARREGMVAFAGHPLVVRDQVVGVLTIFARQALSEATVSTLAAVAEHIALAIEREKSAKAGVVAEERVRYALEAAGVGIWDLDYTTGVNRWSATLAAQYGLGAESLEGTFETFAGAIHPEDREAVLRTVTEATKGGTDFSIHHRILWPDGSVRWMTGAGRILLDERGAPLRGLGISIDVTERWNLEQQYQQGQKMEAVGRLAGGVAHDFNNLLTAILGYCELLLSDLAPTDPRYPDIAEIQKAGESAAGLTRQLLAFSRKQIIEPTVLDLNAVLSDVRALLRRLIGEDVEIRVNLQPELAPVKADRGQLEQIVVNLAMNARDAMPKGGVVTIETADVEIDARWARSHVGMEPGPHVRLTISDSGTGMSKEVQEHLFEPFFTTKEPGKGTGLGLATVASIVARSGGSVDVDSAVGRGTAIHVHFPAVHGEVVPEAPAPKAPSARGGETVLVVDDAEGLRELVRRLLERRGYRVLIAGDAEEAVAVFERNPSIDVLLTDVVMPGASGPELTRQLVREHPALKVIYMSGYTEDAIVRQGVLNPGIVLLNKPFTSAELTGKIREVLDR